MSDIRKLEGSDIEDALALAWKVFGEFEAPEYSRAGIDEFHNFVTEGWKNAEMTFYGAFEEGTIIGMLALRPHRHISLFFVEKDHQGKGVGRELFKTVAAELEGRVLTVNSAPYAVNIYRALGFKPMAKETVTNGIRYTPLRYGECPCHKAKSINQDNEILDPFHRHRSRMGSHDDVD